MNWDLPVEQEFPFGLLVWHKINGQKFMVIGYSYYMDGSTLIILNGGEGDRTLMPDLLTKDNPELKPIDFQ